MREGLKCRFVIEERVPGSYRDDASGNHFLFRLMGVESLRVVPAGSDMAAAMRAEADAVAALGRKAYVLPGGGSNALGGLGYVACAQELQQQCFEQGVRFDHVIVGSGSSGTHGGLLAGFLGNRIDVPILGIGVSRDPADQDPLVHDEAQAVCDLLGLDLAVPRALVRTSGDYWRPKYSLPNRRMVEAVQLLARTEAILLDPVYTGKVMAGLIDLARKGFFGARREGALPAHGWAAVAVRLWGRRAGRQARGLSRSDGEPAARTLPSCPWPGRAALVALVATVCGCNSLQAPRDAPPDTRSPAASVRPGEPDDAPSAEDIVRANPQISRRVALAIEHVLRQPSDHRRAAVLDFSVHSATPRFHLVERASGRVLQTLRVAHGQGSEGARRDGHAEVFSNVPDSNASSLGLYRTAETYVSDAYPGLAMRMDGLSPTNSNARSRFIVIHAARYMEPESWDGKPAGRPGLSDGCFAFSSADRDAVLSSLQGGALIYAIDDKS